MTLKAPDVSVIIPAYAEPGFLREAVASVVAQRDVELELIVVDDGSPESLEPALSDARSQLGERLHFIRQENAGGAAARNRGLEQASAPWVAFLDHDDVWLPDKLAGQLREAREHPEAALFYCAFERFGGEKQRPIFPIGAPSGDLLDALLENTWIRTLSVVLIRRDALGDESWFDVAYPHANDIDLYYRIAARHPCVFVDEVYVRKRSHDRQASSNQLESHEEYAAIIERLAQRLSASPGSPRDRLLRRRLARHRRGAGKAALARADFELSLAHYRASLRLQPFQPRAWRGFLAATVAARRPLPKARGDEDDRAG